MCTRLHALGWQQLKAQKKHQQQQSISMAIISESIHGSASSFSKTFQHIKYTIKKLLHIIK